MSHRVVITFAIVALRIGCCTPLLAQPVTPPADAPPPAAPAAAEPLVESNPAVLAVLESPRKTPADYFQAVIRLVDLGRTELAKPILDELTKLQLTDAQRAELVTRFGSRDMLLLSQTKELAPAGAQFASACMNAAAAATTDPNRIATLIAQLVAPSAEARLIARNDLAAMGQPGVNATLEALARETDPARRAALASAARQMHPLVVPPLLAMLETSDPALRSTVGAMLEYLAVRQALPLLPQAPGLAEQALTNALRDYRRGMLPFAADANDEIELWQWDDATRKLSARKFAADEARIIWMARLARELARYSPHDDFRTQQALLLELEAAALAGNANPHAAAELKIIDRSKLNQLLADALRSSYTHAAAAAIENLAELGFDDVLHSHSSDGQRAALVRALDHPNRRVRFAALRAIMKLDPKTPYAGASRVPDMLAWFAAGTGERRAVVAMPTAAAATNLAGMMAVEGLQATATATGREAVDQALAMPDLEMILVDVNINGPPIRQVIYELRVKPTTAEIPIAILAPNSRLAVAQQIASEHERVVAVHRVQSPEVLHQVVERLTRLSGRFAPPPNARAAEAVEALAWLSKLASGERPFYRIRRSEPIIEAALYRPDAAKPAIAALGKLGTAEGQNALLDFASLSTLSVEARSHAADAFRHSVAEHGLLLTSDEILRQYDRYNASETADADTQRILGVLLDAIESRRGNAPADKLPNPARK